MTTASKGKARVVGKCFASSVSLLASRLSITTKTMIAKQILKQQQRDHELAQVPVV